MTDLTKFYGDKGIVLDQNYACSNTSKSNSDLINEMRSHGVLGDFYDTTGNLVRVPRRAGVNQTTVHILQ